MFAPACARASVPSGTRSADRLVRPAAFVVLGLVMLLAGCARPPSVPVVGGHPADPGIHARPTAYQPVLGRYASQRPRDPSEWRENNERVAPQEKP